MIWLLLSLVSFAFVGYFVLQAPEMEEVEECSQEEVEYIVQR